MTERMEGVTPQPAEGKKEKPVRVGKLSSGSEVSSPLGPGVDSDTAEKSQRVAAALGGDTIVLQSLSPDSRAVCEKLEGETVQKTEEIGKGSLLHVEEPSFLKGLVQMLRKERVDEGRIGEIVNWCKINWDKVAFPDGSPRPFISLRDPHHVQPLDGLIFFTNVKTNKVTVQISLGQLCTGGIKKVDLVLTVSSEGVFKQVCYEPHDDANPPTAEEIERAAGSEEKRAALSERVAKYTIFIHDVEKEIYWRGKILEGNKGVLPETITKMWKISYIDLRTGETQFRYLGDLCEGNVFSLITLLYPPSPEGEVSSDREQQTLKEISLQKAPATEIADKGIAFGEEIAKETFLEVYEQTIRTVLGYYLDILPAVEVLHRCGIAQGDLKPDNILFNRGKGLLLDFGMAAEFGFFGSRGSIGYIAPELIDGGLFSAESDMFSFGMMLYELMSVDDFLKYCALQARYRETNSPNDLKICKDFLESERLMLETTDSPILLLISELIRQTPGRPHSGEVRRRLQKIIEDKSYIM